MITIGQNLVNNPSFESHSECPPINKFNGVSDWNPVVRHFGTPDYYNPCSDSISGNSVPKNWFGFQTPYNGSAYIGIYGYTYGDDAREYVQTKLKSPLIVGTWYRLSFFTSLSDESDFAVNKLGIVLSKDSIFGNNSHAHLNFVPVVATDAIISDKKSWTLVSGEYKASGGEQFLTLGNFYGDDKLSIKALTINAGGSAYYFIDEVSVLKTDSANCNDIAAYPNPTFGTITFEYGCQTIYQIKIFSASGQLVKEIDHYVNSINLKELAAGLYLVVLITKDNKRFVKKVIKITR